MNSYFVCYMHYILYSHFGISQRKGNVGKIVRKRKFMVLYYIYFLKIPHLSGPVQFKPMSFKGQLYYASESNLEFVNAVR